MANLNSIAKKLQKAMIRLLSRLERTNKYGNKYD